ncbi:14569_t:CDS:1, partial [Dentiscutata heterogama]
ECEPSRKFNTSNNIIQSKWKSADKFVNVEDIERFIGARCRSYEVTIL